MTPIRTEYSNVTYTAEGCFDLPATIASRQDGSQEVETVWAFTKGGKWSIVKYRHDNAEIMAYAFEEYLYDSDNDLVMAIIEQLVGEMQ